VQLSLEGLEDYLARIAELLERYGVVLNLERSEPLIIQESPSGAMSFELRGFLPDGRMPRLSTLEVRERWRRLSPDHLERREYEFELLDHERDVRRAFHLHDAEAFIRRLHVVVHEHCEHPIGTTPCDHISGPPVRDAFHGVELLLQAWIDPSIPDCAAMTCLE
jgi:hypothetical protein